MKNIEETIFESLKNDLLDHVNKEIIGQTRQICEELTGEPPFLDALYELVDAAEESIRAELYPKPVKPVKPSKPAPKKTAAVCINVSICRGIFTTDIWDNKVSVNACGMVARVVVAS